MKQISYFNEKGNAKVQVRNAIKSQAMEKVVETLGLGFDEVVVNANGGISIPLASDNGTIIYANLDLAISTLDPTVRRERKAKAPKTSEPADIPTLW